MRTWSGCDRTSHLMAESMQERIGLGFYLEKMMLRDIRLRLQERCVVSVTRIYELACSYMLKKFEDMLPKTRAMNGKQHTKSPLSLWLEDLPVSVTQH